MHLSDIQDLFKPSSSIHIVWDDELSPSITFTNIRSLGVGVFRREVTNELCRMLESSKVRLKFRQWPQYGYVAVEKNSSAFELKLIGFVTITVPRLLVDRVFSTGNPEFFEERGYRFRMCRGESRHGAKWVTTEVCECAPGLDPRDAVRYRAQLVGHGRTLDEAFRSVLSSTVQEATLPGNAWYS